MARMVDTPETPIPSIDPSALKNLTPGAAQVANAIAELVQNRKALKVLTLPSSGIRLNIKPVPRAALERAFAGVEELKPKPPMWANPTTGKDQPNPSNPDYLARLEAWSSDVVTRATKIYISGGTSIASVPEGYYLPQDAGWVDELEVMGLDVSEIPPFPYPLRPEGYVHPGRYLAWAELYAFRDELDMTMLFMQARDVMGTKEETVADAMRYFWRRAQRSVGLEPGPSGEGGHGDSLENTDPA